ncbi:hypothetical protein ACWD6N_03450 [Micromonospora sp. NPDC005163]
MQPLTAVPRDELTVDEVVGLVQNAPGLIIGYGAELLDQDLGVLEDISADLSGGQVSRASSATLHGTARLTISRDLDWPRAIVRPFMTISDGQLLARFNLGAYYTNTQRRQVGRSVPSHDVDCYDILHGLNDPVGEAYAVDAGIGYLTAVEDILVQRGYTQHVIDRTAAGLTLPAARVWPFDAKTTWLTVVNDLLSAVGYAGIWSDWDGRLRCHPYESPIQRVPEWVYDTGPLTSMLADRAIERDYFNAPNRWVVYRQNNIDGPPPVEGDGMYTYINERLGDTSVEGRGGRIITRTEAVDAADQASLVALAEQLVDADLRLTTTIPVTTAPNPLHWHFDRIALDDPEIGPVTAVLGTQWTLPLTGGDMSQEWTVLEP